MSTIPSDPAREGQKTPFETPYFLDYYAGYRHQYSDLFESEKVFFDDFGVRDSSILDVGCARGGMYQIFNERLGPVNYTGIDISPEMIRQAKIDNPGVAFSVYDGVTLPYAADQFDRVLSLGTTVHDPEYTTLIHEGYRVARNVYFFDIRLTDKAPTLADVSRGYVQDGSDAPYPYVIASVEDFATCLKNLNPAPSRIRGYGYWGAPNAETTVPKEYEKICLATFMIYKPAPEQTAATSPSVELNLPVSLPGW